jgi:hypothetical protein
MRFDRFIEGIKSEKISEAKTWRSASQNLERLNHARHYAKYLRPENESISMFFSRGERRWVLLESKFLA